MLPPNSGVLYIVWGDAERLLQRSINSLRAVHPDLPVHVHRLPEGSNALDRASMLDFTPFEHTLCLHPDTIVMRRLDFAFEKAAKHALACCICECPWARRYAAIEGPVIEYGSGVLFFSRTVRPLFDRWKQKVREVDSRYSYRIGEQSRSKPVNDQAALAIAMEETGTVPFVLPPNWNYRPRFMKAFFGPLLVWHAPDELPPQLGEWNRSPLHNDRLIPMVLLNL